MPLLPFLNLLSSVPRGRLVLLFTLMLLSKLTEGIGIILLVPFLGLLQGQASAGNSIPDAAVRMLSSLGLQISLAGMLGLFLLLIVVRNIVQYYYAVLNSRVQFQVVDTLRDKAFLALLRAEWRWYASKRQADHTNILLTEVDRIGFGFRSTLVLLTTLATLLVYVATAFLLSWPMTAIALASGSFVFLLLAGQRRRALALGEELSEAGQKLHQVVEESLSGFKLTKILGSEMRHLDLFRQVVARLRQQVQHFVASIAFSQALYQTGGALLLVVFLYVGLTELSVPMAELLVLVLVFSRLIPQFGSAQQSYHQLLNTLPALRRMEGMLDECRRVAEPRLKAVDTGSNDEPALWPVEKAICLHQVSVRYESRNAPALESLSLCLKARSTTAIMGTSGAGKSTLADVLMGLLVPDAGQLLVDDQPVAGLDRLRWRHSVAYVPQEVFLFNDSIRNNLLWGNPVATERELEEALKKSAARFVFDLPLRLDTVVGDGGIRLSGGERQRLALARALLSRPSLLILDEATSALDLENEARVRTAIENLHGDVTVAIIGHRIATLEHADQVVVLEDGKIKSCGTWKEVNSTPEELDACK